MDFEMMKDGVLRKNGQLCVPEVDKLREKILEETHIVSHAIHHRTTKIYWTLKSNYWWPFIKKDVAEYVARCLSCQQIKIKHQASTEKFKSLLILE